MTRRVNAFRWFKQVNGERLVQAPSSLPAVLMDGGVHMPAWERRPVPDPGPMAYAYEGLTKQATGAYGRGGVEFHTMRTFAAPLVALGTQTLQGTGVGSGTFYLQGLYLPLPNNPQQT